MIANIFQSNGFSKNKNNESMRATIGRDTCDLNFHVFLEFRNMFIVLLIKPVSLMNIDEGNIFNVIYTFSSIQNRTFSSSISEESRLRLPIR